MQRPPASDPLIGQTIGSYTVQRKLGEGGMGAVYEILHPGIGKRLALKLLHAEYAARPQIVQRFFDEARAVNVIGHPNIVDILDFNHLPDGRAYLTMEYLEGESLSAYLRRQGALAPAEIAVITRAIASALQAAHQAGIVHRDLKPENIHLVPRPDTPRYVKVLDFGIAKLSAELHATPGAATRSGVVMGTPTYMSPEQAMGRTKEIDHRTDIYALGIILYEMLTGAVPFAADSFGDLMLKHLQEQAPAVTTVRPDLPGPWNQVVQRALAKERDDRFQSMDELAAAVSAAAAGAASAAGPQAATVAASGVALSAGPPAVPGDGTVPPQTYPPSPHPSSPATRSVAPATGSRKPIFFAIAGLLAAVAAAVVFLATRGGDDAEPSAAPMPATIDAGAIATTPPAPPDAAPAVARAPADAAPPPVADPPRKPPGKPTVTVKQRGKGKVKLVAKPWAMVYIDGEEIGSTPRTVELSAGRHTIELKNGELGKSYKKRVTVRAGRQTTITRDWE